MRTSWTCSECGNVVDMPGHTIGCVIGQSESAYWQDPDVKPERTNKMTERGQLWAWMNGANPPHWQVVGTGLKVDPEWEEALRRRKEARAEALQKQAEQRIERGKRDDVEVYTLDPMENLDEEFRRNLVKRMTEKIDDDEA